MSCIPSCRQSLPSQSRLDADNPVFRKSAVYANDAACQVSARTAKLPPRLGPRPNRWTRAARTAVAPLTASVSNMHDACRPSCYRSGRHRLQARTRLGEINMPDDLTKEPPACPRCGSITKWFETNLSKSGTRIIHVFLCPRCENRMIVSEPVRSTPGDPAELADAMQRYKIHPSLRA